MSYRRSCLVGSALAAGLLTLALSGRGWTDDAQASLALTEGSPAKCAFRRLRPCPVIREERLTLHGPYMARTAKSRALRIRFANFGGDQARDLVDARARVGRVVQVGVGRATRIQIVQPDRTRRTASAGALQAALENYESAPVYVSGRLRETSYLDDRLVRLQAREVTLDLSGGATANLAAHWRVESMPGWTVVLARAQESPPTWFGDVTDESGRATATVAFTQPASGFVCAAVFRADEDKAAGFDCGPIADSARRLGPIAPLRRGGPPVTLVRTP